MKEKYINANKSEFGDKFGQINFCTEDKAEEFDKKRQELIREISEHAKWGFSGTKTDCSNLSDGCRLCGEGLWSCLFINGKCNAKCFYCPAPQDEQCLPTTNSVTFASPSEYTAYLKRFGFKGVSISGGEPLLTPDLTCSYISSVREAFGGQIYIWMYTNGILVTTEILHKLKDAGLNEIRFDIGATGYKLDNLKKAIGVIPVVTVEIPAVPEELDQLKTKVQQLAEIGVKHLNLHQLRLTPYNFDKIIKRGYTFIHNENVTVLESELTALKLISCTLRSGINLPINYCSYPFKNRFQGLASRKRNCAEMVKSFEEITENGYIRRITLKGKPEDIAEAESKCTETSMFETARDKNSMFIHSGRIEELDISRYEISVTYFSAKQLQSVSYRNPFKTISLTPEKNIVIERFRASGDIILKSNDVFLITGQSQQKKPAYDQLPEHIADYETVKPGLLEYA